MTTNICDRLTFYLMITVKIYQIVHWCLGHHYSGKNKSYWSGVDGIFQHTFIDFSQDLEKFVEYIWKHCIAWIIDKYSQNFPRKLGNYEALPLIHATRYCQTYSPNFPRSEEKLKKVSHILLTGFSWMSGW